MKSNRKKIKKNREIKGNIRKNILLSILCRLGALLFHEDYAIFTLPLIFFANLFLNFTNLEHLLHLIIDRFN